MDHLYICDRKGQERGLGSKVKSARQDGFSASPAEIQQDGEVSTDGKGTGPRRDEKELQGRVGGTWHFQVLPGEKSPGRLISMKPSWDCMAGLQIGKVTGEF